MKYYLSLFSIALILSACSSSKPYEYWHKEGESVADTKEEVSHCRVDVGAKDLSQEKAKKLIAYCMKSKGYTLEKGYR